MNAALGQGGVILGVAASLGGVATLAVALRQRRLHLIAVGRSYALLALLGAVVAVAAMERALITRYFTVQYSMVSSAQPTSGSFRRRRNLWTTSAM